MSSHITSLLGGAVIGFAFITLLMLGLVTFGNPELVEIGQHGLKTISNGFHHIGNAITNLSHEPVLKKT